MPHGGRPPGGTTGVGRYHEGVEDDVLKFQEVDSEDDKNGVLLDGGFEHGYNDSSFSPDELYFNDMNIRDWEQRASAFGGVGYGPHPGYQEEDEGYYDDMGEIITPAEYEEMLFRRVLDKIRIARAAGNDDVQLSSEEVDAYQSKLHGGARTPAVRPNSHPQPRPTGATMLNDAGNVAGVDLTSKLDTSSLRTKKNQQRTSIFGSKPKKEKPISRKRTSTASSVASHTPPGFVVPGPDGQPMYAPIHAYQGSLARDPGLPSRPVSRSATINNHQVPSPPRYTPPANILGAFPGSEHTYRPATPPRQERSAYARQPSQGQDFPVMARTRSSSIQSARLIPFPIEPYQYHAFSPTSLSPTSPQPQYARRVSSGPPEGSYTAMPRRVPVPAQAPVSVQRTMPVAGLPGSPIDTAFMAQPAGYGTAMHIPSEAQEAINPSANAKDGERRRKAGRRQKKI